MQRHFADIWETVADAIPDDIALVHGETRRTWKEYDDRAARLANVMVSAGLKAEAKVGLYAYNSNEYLEAHFAVFKARMVGINVNYRYVEAELTYLFDNADVEAVIYQAQFAPRLAAIRDKLPRLRLFIEIADGSGHHLEGAIDYEKAIASSAPMPRVQREESELYMLYTGGTTGMPKGVMYHIGEFIEGLLRALEIRGLPKPTTTKELHDLVLAVKAAGERSVSLPACPLMHGTGLWVGAFQPLNLGATIVTANNVTFDPEALWRLVEKERVTDISIVGDAFAKPMLAVLRGARDAGKPIDISSLKRIISSGVMFSTDVKRGLLEFCDAMIYDAMGSTEGSMGLSAMSRETPAAETGKFMPNPTTKVFTDDGREVVAGSGDIGMIANGGITPIGYYKDPVKSAKVFRTVNGQRYSFPGDYATIAADGTLVLLGRGSICINTGGEKVFPEEVEEAIKEHPAVQDCLVVGVPDPRFGERVTAVVSYQRGKDASESALIESLRTKLAGYKLPKSIVAVPEVHRAANGKADYKWAKATALERLGAA